MPVPNRLAAPDLIQCISRVGGLIDPNCLRPQRRADAQAADIDVALGESLLLELPSLPGGYHFITTSDASIVWVEQPSKKAPWGLIGGAREGTAVVTLWTGTQENPGQQSATFTVSVHGPATS